MGTKRRGKAAHSRLETRQATGRPGARQRAAEEETAVIEAAISIVSRQSHAARSDTNLESPQSISRT